MQPILEEALDGLADGGDGLILRIEHRLGGHRLLISGQKIQPFPPREPHP